MQTTTSQPTDEVNEMTQMVYNGDRHSYIGERFEVEEDAVRGAYESILADMPGLRAPAAAAWVEILEDDAWREALDESNWTDDMEGVAAAPQA